MVEQTDFERAQESLLVGAISLTMIAIILFAFGVRISIEQFVLLLLGFGALGFVLRRSTDISIGFVLVSLGIGAVIVEYLLPSYLISPFDPFIELANSFFGVDLAAVNAWQYFIISIAAVAILLTVRYRIVDNRVFPDTLTDYVLSTFARYLDRYITIGRLVVAFSFAAVVVAAQQTGELLGVMGTVIADAPLVVSNFFTALAGFLSLGGSLPFVGSVPLFGDLDAAAYAVFALIVIGAAAMVRFSSSGPLAQFLRE